MLANDIMRIQKIFFRQYHLRMWGGPSRWWGCWCMRSTITLCTKVANWQVVYIHHGTLVKQKLNIICQHNIDLYTMYSLCPMGHSDAVGQCTLHLAFASSIPIPQNQWSEIIDWHVKMRK